MWDIHVTGCQFAAWNAVNAQRTLVAVSPAATFGFSETYSPSSKLMNVWAPEPQ